MWLIDRLLQPFIAVFAPTVAVIREKTVGAYGVMYSNAFGPPAPQSVRAQAIIIARAKLREREGYSLRVYADPVKGASAPTVGIGHLVVPSDNLKLGDTISAARVEQFFAQDIEKAMNRAMAQAQELGQGNNPKIIAALASANFQLGDFKSVFYNTFTLLRSGQVSQAISRLYNSAWYRQTPVRVRDLASALQNDWRA